MITPSFQAQAADPYGASYSNHFPTSRWAFDQSVANCFDDMLLRSIPGLGDLRDVITDLVGRIALAGSTPGSILDIGCSNGAGLQSLLDKYGATLRYVAVDNSKPMIEAAMERFKGWVDAKILRLEHLDVTKGFPAMVPPDVVVATLSFQFIRIESRDAVLREVYRRLRPGGAFIITEKTLGSELLSSSYIDFKRRSYTEEEIEAKREALEGVLVPLRPEWVEDSLSSAGFSEIEVVWANRLFKAWVAFKRT